MDTKHETGNWKSEIPSEFELATPEWLREAAAMHERKGETVWAILYRNEAIRIEEGRESR